MFKKTAIITGIALAMSAGAQADYNWELGAGGTFGTVTQELKNNGQKIRKIDTDTDQVEVSGTWYMETVDTSKGPLGEAAFLDASSSIKVEFGDGKVKLTQQNNPDGQTYSADMRYVAEGPGWKLSGWLVDLGYEREEPGNLKIDQYNVGIGKYITDNTTVVLNYESTSLNNGNGSGIDQYGGNVDHFFAIGDGGLKASVNFGRTYVNNREDVDTYGLDAIYYLGNNIGLGINWEQQEESGYEVNRYGVSAEWFISESFAVTMAYNDVVADDIKVDLPGNNLKYDVSMTELVATGIFRF
jgi:hypothetical protein